MACEAAIRRPARCSSVIAAFRLARRPGPCRPRRPPGPGRRAAVPRPERPGPGCPAGAASVRVPIDGVFAPARSWAGRPWPRGRCPAPRRRWRGSAARRSGRRTAGPARAGASVISEAERRGGHHQVLHRHVVAAGARGGRPRPRCRCRSGRRLRREAATRGRRRRSSILQPPISQSQWSMPLVKGQRPVTGQSSRPRRSRGPSARTPRPSSGRSGPNTSRACSSGR